MSDSGGIYLESPAVFGFVCARCGGNLSGASFVPEGFDSLRIEIEPCDMCAPSIRECGPGEREEATA